MGGAAASRVDCCSIYFRALKGKIDFILKFNVIKIAVCYSRAKRLVTHLYRMDLVLTMVVTTRTVNHEYVCFIVFLSALLAVYSL